MCLRYINTIQTLLQSWGKSEVIPVSLNNFCNSVKLIYTVACESLGTPCRICENVNNFNKIREIIQNACYFLFSTVLSKIFYIKYVYI